MLVNTIFLDFGHSSLTRVPGDVGAPGFQFEDENIKKIHDYLVPLLKELNYKVIVKQPTKARNVNASLQERVKNANDSNADLFISIHFNAFNRPSAAGTEVFTSGALSKANKIASNICTNISNLGYTNRGLKWGRFYVIKHTKMPAILVEGHFVTNKGDCDRFDPELTANAIATAIKNASTTSNPASNEVKFEKITLIVDKNTILKPDTADSTDDSFEITKVKHIKAGRYECELVGEEEGHYLVKMPDGKEWFIFSGHVTIA